MCVVVAKDATVAPAVAVVAPAVARTTVMLEDSPNLKTIMHRLLQDYQSD